MERVDEQTETEELLEELRMIQEEQESKYGPLRERYERKHGPLRFHFRSSRRYPSHTVAGIPPELARMFDLTEEEIRKYSATSGNP